MEKSIKLSLKEELPRTTTKKDYKSIARWLRESERHMNEVLRIEGLMDTLHIGSLLATPTIEIFDVDKVEAIIQIDEVDSRPPFSRACKKLLKLFAMNHQPESTERLKNNQKDIVKYFTT